jgi:cell wall-associated NlpC family hydrolase
MKDTHSARQLFAATLVASAAVVLASAKPLLLERHATRSNTESRELRAARLFARHRLSLRDSIVSLARAQVGTPYLLGGTSPRGGFDCSGLVRYVYSRVYWTPPRTARQQARVGAPIGRPDLQPGDLLTFGNDGITHIGIYVGDGQFVHASSVAGRVILSPLNRRPSRLIRPLRGVRRLLAVANPTPLHLGVN